MANPAYNATTGNPLYNADGNPMEGCCCEPEQCVTCRPGPATLTLTSVMPCWECIPGVLIGPDTYAGKGEWSMEGSLSGTWELIKRTGLPSNFCFYQLSVPFTGLVLRYHGAPYPTEVAGDCEEEVLAETDTLTLDIFRTTGPGNPFSVSAEISGEYVNEFDEVFPFSTQLFGATVTLDGDFCGEGSEPNGTSDCREILDGFPGAGTVALGTGGTCDVSIPS